MRERVVHLYDWNTIVALLLSTEVRTFFSSSSDAIFSPGSVRHVMDFVSSSFCGGRSSGHVHWSCSPPLLADLFNWRTHLLIDFSRSARESQSQRRQPVLVRQHDRGAVFWIVCCWSIKAQYPFFFAVCSSRNLILSGISAPFTSLVQPSTTLVPWCLSLIVFAADALRNRPSFNSTCVANSSGQQ